MKRLLSQPLLVSLLTFLPVYILYSSSRHIEVYAAILDLILVLLAAIFFWVSASAAAAAVDRIWFRISIGLFVWCIAICFRLCEMALNLIGYGSIADGWWLVGYLPLGLGAYLWFRLTASERPRLRPILILAGVLAGILVLVAVWPVISNPTRPAVFKTLDLLYPSLDLLLVILLTAPSLQQEAWGCRILNAAFVLLLVSDILFSYYGEDPASKIYRYLDLPYTTSYFLLAIAGNAQRLMLRQPANKL